MARLLIIFGLLLLLAGVLLAFFPRALSWFGSLPGDIDIRRGNTRVFIPLGSMLVVSVGLTILLNLIAWLLRYFR
ncbi:MAG TPA: DUF2905 domain-containing protein [Trueperaceae bacterium]